MAGIGLAVYQTRAISDLEERTVGIIQFVMLLFFVLIYVGIVGGLLMRLTKRGLGSFAVERNEEAQQVPLRG